MCVVFLVVLVCRRARAPTRTHARTSRAKENNLRADKNQQNLLLVRPFSHTYTHRCIRISAVTFFRTDAKRLDLLVSDPRVRFFSVPGPLG